MSSLLIIVSNFRDLYQCKMIGLYTCHFLNLPLKAQTNLTLMNTLVWGTCNTNLGINQCNANMGWFSSALETACNEDLKNGISLAGDTLTGKSFFVIFLSS